MALGMQAVKKLAIKLRNAIANQTEVENTKIANAKAVIQDSNSNLERPKELSNYQPNKTD